MSNQIEPGVCCQEHACTVQSQLDEALALLQQVAVPPPNGAPAKEVATWLLAQEDAIDFLKKMKHG